MRILFVSKEACSADLVRSFMNESCEVKMYIREPLARECFDGIVEKVTHWKKELNWVGKDGLIIFDDISFGKIQDKLRSAGYNVCGGSELGERTEIDREFGSNLFAQAGMKTVPLKNFNTVHDAISFVEDNPAQWVIKQNNQAVKNFTYVGNREDGRDVIEVLKAYSYYNHLRNITLQKRVEGVEIGVARYFNGHDWVGPVEVNVEHTRLFPDDIGPITSEMGTVAWYEKSNKLFDITLNRLAEFLREANFRGDMSLNCIVNEHEAVPLESTARFGTPIIHLQTELHESPWSEFLFAVATGKDYDVKYKNGYGVVTVVAAPPFPYRFMRRSYSSYKKPIWLPDVSSDDYNHIHFEEVAYDPIAQRHYVADSRGCVLHVTAVDSTISGAREKTLSIIKDIHIPKMFYRKDIGDQFEKEQLNHVKLWGYINGPYEQ
jgi:phosphoribosylamine--glycine ligase